MPPRERKRRIEKIKEKIQKEEKFIIITTQLIEAGVDISVDRIIRDLAPLDKIIQTAGRTNRNNEKKQKSQVRIIKTKDIENEKGTPYCYYIYNKILLSETEKILKNNKKISEKEARKKVKKYFQKVIKNTKQGIKKEKIGKDINLFDEIKKLNHKTVKKHFNLIQETEEISIFIANKNTIKIWKKYNNLMNQKITPKVKKELSSIKKDINKNKITIKTQEKEKIKETIRRKN
ncbi:MAG: helicase-related protein, partial [archaeon]